MNKDQKKSTIQIPVIHLNSAGIDVGDKMHVVAVPADRDEVPVRQFGAFTCDLLDIVAWLKRCNIDSVAMESTGIYWKNLFSVLIKNGFEVYLVNARYTKNVSGRKTDEKDAQWIQRLHSCGLLPSSFLPDDVTESLRTIVRHRKKLTDDSSRCILRMQKSLELMNIKIHTEISDITGKSGQAIINAILEGERKAENFLPLFDRRIKADRINLLKSLEGFWREEHVFTLKQNYSTYKYLHNQIAETDQYIAQLLKKYLPADEPIKKAIYKTPTGKIKAKKKNKNQPAFDVRGHLHTILQTDVVEIFGLSETTGLQILAECGIDYSKWASSEHFVSWLNLSPNTKITGGKIISNKMMKKKPNLATQAFRAAANGLQKSDNWLGDYFRRMRAKGGQKYAIVATARKLAMIYYEMVTKKEPFIPFDRMTYNKRTTEIKIAKLERALERLKCEAA